MPIVVESPSSTLERFPHINADPCALSPCLDPFTITKSTGFLPCRTPPTRLPAAFKPLASLLDRLPVVRDDGSPGLLAEYALGPAVLAELPDLTAEIDKLVTANGQPDLFTITALFRDYAFLASAYLLEPCWESWRKNPNGGYGLGRSMLPKSIARPTYHCAQLSAAMSLYPRCRFLLTLH
jgi:indoleamine 2,3-dioxygenase